MNIIYRHLNRTLLGLDYFLQISMPQDTFFINHFCEPVTDIFI